MIRGALVALVCAGLLWPAGGMAGEPSSAAPAPAVAKAKKKTKKKRKKAKRCRKARRSAKHRSRKRRRCKHAKRKRKAHKRRLPAYKAPPRRRAPGKRPAGSPPSGGTPGAPLGRYLSVATSEFALSLSRPALAAGSVTLELRNVGEDPHNLVVSPDDGSHSPLASFADTPSGGISTRSLTLPAGRYYLFCSLEGHESAGMHAQLRVQ